MSRTALAGICLLVLAATVAGPVSAQKGPPTYVYVPLDAHGYQMTMLQHEQQQRMLKYKGKAVARPPAPRPQEPEDGKEPSTFARIQNYFSGMLTSFSRK